LHLEIPQTGPEGRDEAPKQSASLAVVVPTRSRPERLRRCLDSLAVARERLRFPVYVCDSSPSEEERAEIRAVCEDYDWALLSTHDGTNIPAARNACTRAAREELLVNVDDDLLLEPEAIERLLARYDSGSGRRVVSGSLSWDGTWTRPVKMRAIGYGRPVEDGEAPDFVHGAFFLYPRALGLAWPWNERCDEFDDIFMGALWRRHGVSLLFAADARALHPELPASSDPARIAVGARRQRFHIYVLLFESAFAEPSLTRTLAYETLGFLASAKLYFRRPRWAASFVWGWLVGHARLLADWRYLRRLVRSEPDSL
jgi:glycosyltransferase involved in cell wall biosynthesis